MSASTNERLSQDTLYQDYRYLVGVYNNQYLEILRQIDDLRQEALVVRDIINATTLDMRRRMRDLTSPSAPGVTVNPITASLLVAQEDEVIQTFFNGLLGGVRTSSGASSGASYSTMDWRGMTGTNSDASSGASYSTMDWRGMTAQRPTTIPSARQINEAVRVIRYGDMGERETQERCPISWATFNEEDRVSQIIHCGHVFNSTELSRWFLTNARCPLCRHDIRDATSGASGGANRNETAQIHDVSGNLVDVDTVLISNWAHGLN